MTIICFTYAGGTASFYDFFDESLSEYEIIKIEYAGHGDRRKEPFYCNFKQLAEDIYKIVKPYTKGDYALFGYSMGTIALVEVLKRIIDDGNENLPKRVFLAAHEPHIKTELAGYRQDELDDWIKERTFSFGDIPEILLDNKPFWRMYLPIYRADYALIGEYRFEDISLETKVPASVFYSEQDTPLAEMLGWKKYFIGDTDYHKYEGKHFFIKEHYEAISEVIKIKLGATK